MIFAHIDDAPRSGAGQFNKYAWRALCAAMSALTPSTPDGNRWLGDDPTAPRMEQRVMTYETRRPHEAVLEAHRRHIDVQLVLGGAEYLDVYSQPALRILTPYDPARDVEFYQSHAADSAQEPGCAARLALVPGFFCVLFPADAHMPQLSLTGTPQSVKKCVYKIPLDLWRNDAS